MFERGVVMAAPSGAIVNLDSPHMDISTGVISDEFSILTGDGRIYLRIEDN